MSGVEAASPGHPSVWVLCSHLVGGSGAYVIFGRLLYMLVFIPVLVPSIVRIALSLFGFSLWYLDPCVVPVPLNLLHYGSCEMYETAAAVHLLPAVCERVWPHLCVWPTLRPWL